MEQLVDDAFVNLHLKVPSLFSSPFPPPPSQNNHRHHHWCHQCCHHCNTKLATTLLLIYQTLPLILVADLLVILFPLSQLTFTFLGPGLCSRFVIVILTQSWNHYPFLLSSLLPLSSQVPVSIHLPLDQHPYSLQHSKLQYGVAYSICHICKSYVLLLCTFHSNDLSTSLSKSGSI